MNKKMEKNASKRDKSLLLPIDKLTDPAVIVDKNGRLLEVSKAVEEITGLKKRELVGKTFLDLDILTEESKRTIKENLARRFAGERVELAEIEALTKDGKKRPLNMTGLLIEYEGEPADLVIFRDITELKAAEEALRDSRDQYQELLRINRQILERSPTGILKLDDKLRIVYENPAMKKILGVPPGEKPKTIGTDIREVPSVKTTGIAGMFNDLLKGKEISAELPFESLYGKRSFLSIICSPIFDGVKFMGAVLIAHDMTERKQAEEELRKSEAKYCSLVESSTDSIYMLDEECRYLTANEELLSRVAMSRDEVIGKSFGELHSPEETTEFAGKVKEVLETGKVVHHEHRSDRLGRWFLRTLGPVRDPETGKITAITVISKDITERKKLEDRIRAEREIYRSIARAANRSRTVEELCELALKDIQTTIKYDLANISVYRESENALFSAAQVGHPKVLYEKIIKRQDLKGQGVTARAVRERKSVYIDDMKTSELTSYAHDLIVKYDISALYAVPLFSRNKLQGVLEVLTVGTKKLSKEDREVLDTISEELAGGIAKAKIEETLLTAKEAFGWLTQG